MITNKGERQLNEDSITVAEFNGNYLFVLADGLGGHGHGEVASSIVTSSAKALIDDSMDYRFPHKLLSSVFDNAQSALLQKQKDEQDSSSFKTTAVLLLVNDALVQWGYIGDSRLYYFRKNRLIRHTLDHSVPQMLVSAGLIKEREIRGHEDRSKLLRVLGTQYDSVKYVVESSVIREKGQAFLLCSDGFWEWIDEKTMTKLLKKSHSAQEWLDMMVVEVQKNGTGNQMDNFSAIAVLL